MVLASGRGKRAFRLPGSLHQRENTWAHPYPFKREPSSVLTSIRQTRAKKSIEQRLPQKESGLPPWKDGTKKKWEEELPRTKKEMTEPDPCKLGKDLRRGEQKEISFSQGKKQAAAEGATLETSLRGGGRSTLPHERR